MTYGVCARMCVINGRNYSELDFSFYFLLITKGTKV